MPRPAWLPLGRSEPMSSQVSSQPSRWGHAPRRILLVEDHDDCRVLFTRMLQYEGFLVTASDTAHAVEAADGEFDLVIVGVGPKPDRAARLLRQLRGHRGDLPALALSSISGHLEDSGFTLVLMKPGAVDQLIETVEHLMAVAAPR